MIRILVADDHPIFRRGLVSVLETHPELQVVGEATSGPEIMAKAGAFKPDVMVTDISVGGADGVETAKLVRQRLPRVKVLILTASENEDDFYRAIKAGAGGYLLKSVGLAELVKSIHLVAYGDVVVSPAMTAKLVESRGLCRNTNLPEMDDLSPRETQILQLAAEGASNKEIANHYSLSETTVKTHLRNIMEKLSVRNRAEAVAKAMARGLVKVAV
ncbi:MAG: response regulator transcription factor [Chloroflexi bacterium]|nr:response regulator transcription factor [Chloroflexota bacterium]